MVLDDTHNTMRRAQEAQRVAIMLELTANEVRTTREAIRAQMPGAPESQVLLRWIELVYGKDLAERVAPFADRLGVS